MTDQDGRLLVVALELLRKQLVDDATHRLHNSQRDREPPPWVKGFENLFANPDAASGAHGAGGTGVATAGSKEMVLIGHRGPPIPVYIVGGKADWANDLLVKQHLDEQAAFDKKPKTGLGDAKPGKDKGAAIADAIIGRFAALLGPLAVLQAVLGQTNSGFGVFQKSMSVMGATLAPLVLPAFVLLAAGVLSVSDVIWSKLLPALDGFYKWAMKFVPAGEAATTALGAAADLAAGDKKLTDEKPSSVLGKFLDLTPFAPHSILGRNLGVPSNAPRTDSVFGGAGDWLADKLKYSPQGLAYNGLKSLMGGGGKGGGTGAGDFSGSDRGTGGGAGGKPTGAGVFAGNMRDVLRSLQMSLGPKAAYSAVADAEKQRTLAALNTDPLDAKMLQRSIIAIQTLLASIDGNTKQGPKPQYPGGGPNGGDF